MWQSFSRGIAHSIPVMIISYLNTEWLYPKYFITKKYIWYLVFNFIFIITAYHVISFLDINLILKDYSWSEYLPNIFYSTRVYLTIVGVIAIGTAYKATLYAILREKEANSLKSEKLEHELKFLKSQVNPHFLFNVLHNIYTLSYIKSDKAPEMILKLSEMLRYMTYEGNSDFVPVEKEINYINNYIHLMSLKNEQQMNLEYQLDCKYDLKIPPMMLIPLIENSFKHSKIEDLQKGWIKMKLDCCSDKLNFEICNSLPNSSHAKDKVGGIGLVNLERRLQLIYPGRHRFEITKKAELFKVNLVINFSK